MVLLGEGFWSVVDHEDASLVVLMVMKKPECSENRMDLQLYKSNQI